MMQAFTQPWTAQRQGRVLCLGDDINTDVIYPARYMALTRASERAAHVLEGLGRDIQQQLATHSIVAAGWNMGCGSSREQAATALQDAGVQLVIARSFSRIFFRNCINTGLAVVESCELVDALCHGDEVHVDLAQGHAQLHGTTLHFHKLPDALLAILADGGLLQRLHHRFAYATNPQ